MKTLEEKRKYQREYMRKRRLNTRLAENARDRARREANPDFYRAKDRELYQKRKDKIKEYRLTKQKNLIPNRTKVNNYIRDGKLVRRNCQVCEKNGVLKKGDAHHSDYSKPLDILWLCKLHHAAWHRIFIPEYGSTKEV